MPTRSTTSGRRHTWLKLAAPRVEALRQAFIASESRLRIEFERSEDGGLRETGTSPDVTSDSRPWLKQVSVTGPGSFFSDANAASAGFRLSPDLTCIIGGSMTGKSTLLDGLRVHTGATLPGDESIREQVETRGNAVFAAGSPQVDLDCPAAIRPRRWGRDGPRFSLHKTSCNGSRRTPRLSNWSWPSWFRPR